VKCPLSSDMRNESVETFFQIRKSRTKTPQTRLSHRAPSLRRHRRVAIFRRFGRASGCLPELTGEILWTAICSAEYPWVGISTAHLRPFVPAISDEKPLALRLSQNLTAPLVPLFRKGNCWLDLNGVGASLLQPRFCRCLDGGRQQSLA